MSVLIVMLVSTKIRNFTRPSELYSLSEMERIISNENRKT